MSDLRLDNLYLPSALWIGATAVIPFKEGYLAQLRLEPKYGEPITLGYQDKDKLHVPLNLVSHDGATDCRVKFKPYEHNYKVSPRDEDQARVLGQAKELLDAGYNFIAEAPTGWGKSWLGCSLAVHLAQPTLIIIPKSDLIASWRKNLTDTLGVSPDDIGIVKGADVNYKNKRFVIALVQSVIREGKFEDDFYSTFGLVIWDEVHRMSADSFSKSCMLFNARHRLGLSATTYRGDGKMPVVEAHIGKVMVKGKSVPMQPKILVVKTGYKIPAYSLGGKKLFYSAGRMMQAYEDMGCNDSRNNYIIDFVLSSIKADRQGIVLMSDMIDKHLRKLHSLLLKRGVNADEIGVPTSIVLFPILTP
jgi:superfamily II DNA or RNA helicase